MDNQKYEVASMILRFYNMQTGRAFRLQENAEKINAVSNAVDKLGGVAETKIFIKKWIKENPERANASFTSWIDDAMMTSSTTNTPATTPTEQAVTNSLGILEQALIEVIKKQSVPQIEKDIKSECTQLLQDFIKQESSRNMVLLNARLRQLLMEFLRSLVVFNMKSLKLFLNS